MDNWDAPTGASDTDCHLMVESMETWFLADIDALKTYYGSKFNESTLPKRQNIEENPKEIVFASLINASRDTTAGAYDKGIPSFEILALLNPEKVCAQSPWANRFITLLKERMR